MTTTQRLMLLAAIGVATLANPPYLTLSIGVATVISGDPGIKEVFAQADAQLYIAKNMGRNQVRVTVIGEPPTL